MFDLKAEYKAKGYITIREAAKLLGVAYTSVCYMADTGKLERQSVAIQVKGKRSYSFGFVSKQEVLKLKEERKLQGIVKGKRYCVDCGEWLDLSFFRTWSRSKNYSRRCYRHYYERYQKRQSKLA